MCRCSLYWRLLLLACLMTIGFVLATDTEVTNDGKDYDDDDYYAGRV